MNIIKTFPRIVLSVVLSLTFFLLPLNNIEVYADSYSDGYFWHGLYVEHVTKEISGTAVDIGDADSTDYGLTTGNYIYNKSGVTTQDVIDYVTEQYNNASGYIADSTSDYADKVKNVLNRTIDGTVSAGYKAQKALRTVTDSTGNVYYNVSSSDYWSGIYNKWFNNGGYNDIYENTASDSWEGTSSNVSWSFRFGGIGYYTGVEDNDNSPFFSGGYKSITTGSDRKQLWIGTANGITTYYISNVRSDIDSIELIRVYTNPNYPKRLYYEYKRIYHNENNEDTWNYVNTYINVGTNINQSTTPQVAPAQVGFIIYNGDKVPIYTDKTLNPSDWVINDNGTVSVNGDDYPALVDENEISDDGWLDMLNLVDGEDQRVSDKDPWGNDWDTQDDGSALGGFFGNLVKDIQKMFKGIGDKIKEIFEKPIDVLSDLVEKIKKALSEFWTMLIGDVEGYSDLFETNVDNNFGMISDLYDLLLECMGVDA